MNKLIEEIEELVDDLVWCKRSDYGEKEIEKQEIIGALLKKIQDEFEILRTENYDLKESLELQK